MSLSKDIIMQLTNGDLINKLTSEHIEMEPGVLIAKLYSFKIRGINTHIISAKAISAYNKSPVIYVIGENGVVYARTDMEYILIVGKYNTSMPMFGFDRLQNWTDDSIRSTGISDLISLMFSNKFSHGPISISSNNEAKLRCLINTVEDDIPGYVITDAEVISGPVKSAIIATYYKSWSQSTGGLSNRVVVYISSDNITLNNNSIQIKEPVKPDLKFGFESDTAIKDVIYQLASAKRLLR